MDFQTSTFVNWSTYINVPPEDYPHTGKETSWCYPAVFKARKVKTQNSKLPELSWRGGYDALTNEIVTEYGVMNGKMQISRRRIDINSSGRQATTQATLELNHKYHLKINKDGFQFKSLNLSSEYRPIAPIQTSRPFPMLARTATPALLPKIFEVPISTQSKYDGVRCLTVLGEDPTPVSMYSKARNLFEHLVPIFKEELLELFKHLPPTTLIDGELYVEPEPSQPANFQKITSLVRNRKPGSFEKAQAELKYCIFTIYIPSDPKIGHLQRRKLLLEAFEASIPRPSKVLIVNQVECAKLEELSTVHKLNVEHGFEGTMLYKTHGIYEADSRSSNLYKMKDKQDAEGIIMRVKSGRGREKDCALFEVQVLTTAGETSIVTMHPEGTIETRQNWLLQAETLIGKSITYTFQNYTINGLPRFPVARAIRDYE
jgi:hypothetical protein